MRLMPAVPGEIAEQLQQALAVIERHLGGQVHAIHLFGSAIDGGLKPGGFYVIVDHAAAAGSGTGDTQSLHRIDPASVREEVEAAGFVLDAESTMLANEDDPHAIKVFDPSIKGETDRFAYRFVKP